MGPLEGVKVLDLTHLIAGGMSTVLLADYGADVIKVERPLHGDPVRNLGPRKEGKPLWWKVIARNKKCITMDLQSEAGLKLCKELIKQVDVVAENFRPGVLERLGLGWDVIHAENPRAILLRISGYGQTGPYSYKAGFGRAGEAMSGAAYITGYPDKPPTLVGYSLADAVTGLMGAYAVVSALYKRDASGGVGQSIDLALYEPLFRLIDWQVICYDQLGLVAERIGNRFPLSMSGMANVYRTDDGKWVVTSIATQSVADRVLTIIGGPDLAADTRFSSSDSRVKHHSEMDEVIRQWIASHTMEEAQSAFDEGGAVLSPVFSTLDIMADDHYRERENIVSVPDDDFDSVRMPSIIPRMSVDQGEIRWSGPPMGKDNKEVYCRLLGLSEDQLAQLMAQGVV